MSQSNQRTSPFFIVGAPRSGTTLLQYMLRSHPMISMPTGESHFIIPLYHAAKSFGDLRKLENIRLVLQEMYRRSPEFLDTDLHGMRFSIDSLANELQNDGCNTITSIIAGLFKKNALGEGKERWGDKTPYYVLHLPIIIKMFPDAQIIHIIRDGRDCALSMFARKYELNVYNVYHAAKYWQQYVEVGQDMGRKLGPETYLEIRYEDILINKIATVQKICRFLCVPFSDSVIEFTKSDGSGKTPLLQKPIQQDNAEKWRSKMTRRQVSIFESAVGDTLKCNGYPLLTSASPLHILLRVAYRIHNRIMTKYNRKFNKR